MPRSSILSLVVLPLILATAVFVWTPNIAVESRAAGTEPGRAGARDPSTLEAQLAIDALIDTYYLETPGAGRETQRELQMRGNLAHVWSSYGAPGGGLNVLDGPATPQEPAPVELRAFQLRGTAQGWEILSIANQAP